MRNLVKMSVIALACLFASQGSFAKGSGESCVNSAECQQNKIEAMAPNPVYQVLANIDELDRKLDGILKTREDETYQGNAKLFIALESSKTEAVSLLRPSNSSGLSISGFSLKQIEEQVADTAARIESIEGTK